MSEEIVGSCINHNDIRHLRVYHDYMLIYDGNEHKAKIIRILEAWTNTKRAAWYKAAYDNKEQGKPAPVPDFWITMSHQQFSDYMYGTSKPDTIKKNLKELVEKDKHVERRINPEEPYGSPQYRLNIQAVQKKIDELAPVPFLPEIPEIEESSPSDKHTPPGKTTPGKGVGNTPTHGGSLPVPQGGKTATSNNSNYNTGKNKEITSDDVAYAPHHDTPTSFSCALCSEREDLARCADCGTLLCFEHRRDFPSENEPTLIHCLPCVQKHNDEAKAHRQPADTMTATMPVSNDATDASTPLPSQTNNDSTGNVTPSLDRLTASTSDTPSQDHRIANGTPTTDDKQTDTTLLRSGENATASDGVPTEQETPTGLGATQQSRRSRSKANKASMEPIAPPAKPDESAPFDAKKILAWGDYVRRTRLPESTRKGTKYQKAIEAARIIDGWSISENSFLIIFVNWMKGIGLDLQPLPDDMPKSDSWPDYSVDLWVVAEHYHDELKKYNRKKTISLEEKRNEINRKSALGQSTRTQAYGLVPTEELHKSAWEA